MIIHQLKMHNFKSYNGEHTIGPFDAHFTCIIGPNGNGKSNIIDAVLFVFGFKSSKLRQDNIASLIHKSAFGQPDKATVAVIFKENDELISVSRTVNRSGNTYYKLNDERIGWGELREKLVSKKIDLAKNLFIILQGQVERLCQLSPQTMVDYLEYISGSDQLKQSIQGTQKKFIEAAVAREELKMNYKVKKALFDKIKEQTENLTARLYICFRVSLLQHLVMKKMVLDNYSQIDKLKLQQNDKLSAIKQVQKQINKIQALILQKSKQAKAFQAEINKIYKQINEIESQCSKTILSIKNNVRETSFLNNDWDKKKQELKRYQLQLNELNSISLQQKDFIQKIAAIKKTLNSQKQLPKLKLCYEMQSKLKHIKTENQTILNNHTQKQMKLKEGREKINIFSEKTKQYKTQKQKHRARLSTLKSEKAQIQHRLKQSQEIVEQLQRQIKNKKDQKKSTLSLQQKIINQIRSANKYKIICPQITLNTLRDIVVIDPAYSEVVQAILPQLNYFIVDNVKQAKQISEYLKKKQIGRMTFLIKQLINQLASDIKIIQKPPNQTQLISNLIKCTESYARNILIWALGNTLVTHQLDIAMKVGYYDEKRFRVITTKGQFIDSSGTITKLALGKGQKNQDESLIAKRLDLAVKSIENLQKNKMENTNEEKQLNSTLLIIEQDERTFDGLDEVILDQLQKEIISQSNILKRNSEQVAIISKNLQNIKDKLRQSSFDIKKYEEYLEMLGQTAQNQQKIKKIQNFEQLSNSLKQKQGAVKIQIEQIGKKIELKLKQKIVFDTQKQKLQKKKQIKQQQISVINYSKQQICKVIDGMNQQKQTYLKKLVATNEKCTEPRLKQQLLKLKTAIKNIEYEQLQLKNKLHDSIKQIVDLTNVIYNSVHNKFIELVPQYKPTSDMEEIVKVKQQLGVFSKFSNQTVLTFGKKDIRFVWALSKNQKQFLSQNVSKMSRIYVTQNDFRSQFSEFDIYFDSIQLKQLKFSHSFQKSKLKFLQNDEQSASVQNFDFQLYNEYRDNKSEIQNMQSKLLQLQTEQKNIKEQLISLRQKRLSIFMNTFNEINLQLGRIYTKLTGGKAQLNFIDTMNPFQGVQFQVRPINKSWRRVNLLSGGQKTFTSLALIFACEEIKKFPFYFMDQIDAALDYKNTTLLSQYIKEKTGTQHIVISLRKNMYRECNRLVGIYKVKDQSRTIQVKMSELKKQMLN